MLSRKNKHTSKHMVAKWFMTLMDKNVQQATLKPLVICSIDASIES